MITVKSGGETIYHPGIPELRLVSPRLVLEDNAAGSLAFKIYRDNPNYGSVGKLYPLVTVCRDGKTIFKGRVVSDKTDFYNGRDVEAEGKLAFFNDSYLEPFEFRGSPEELFRMVVENHNSMVKKWQQFKVGIVTVKDSNDYIVRSSEGILNSWEALKSRCFQSSLGGHIRIRYEADGDYVDWLQDYTKVSAQSIEFARNIISLSRETDATETYTAIRPVGAEVDGKKVNIETVNGGRAYLVNEKAAERYGIIFAPEGESVWEDVTIPENLLKKAEEKLYGSMAAIGEAYEIRAVDLHLTDQDVEALDICEYVPVVSGPHGIGGNYLLSKADISIASPQDSVYYLGSSRRVLSDMASVGSQDAMPKRVSALENDAGYLSEEKAGEILAEYPKLEEVQTLVSGAVEGVGAGESAYEAAVRNGFEGTEAEWLDSLRGMPGLPGGDGAPGKAAGFGVPVATVDGNVGTPSVEVSASGDDSEKVFTFAFHNLKGEPGKDGKDGEPGKDGAPGKDGKDGAPGVAGSFSGTISLEGDVTGSGSGSNPIIISTTVNSINGVGIGQDAEGNWGYIPPGADAVVPFKSGGSGGGGGMGFPLLGVVPSDTAGTLWMEDGGNEMSGSEQVFVLSSSPNAEDCGIWCGDGEPFALSFTVPGVPSDEIGAMWIE